MLLMSLHTLIKQKCSELRTHNGLMGSGKWLALFLREILSLFGKLITFGSFYLRKASDTFTEYEFEFYLQSFSQNDYLEADRTSISQL